jgi:hypothetical protein
VIGPTCCFFIVFAVGVAVAPQHIAGQEARTVQECEEQAAESTSLFIARVGAFRELLKPPAAKSKDVSVQ